MRPNRLRELLNAGEPSVGTHVMISWPGIVEIIGRAGGIDYVEFVSEYVPYDLAGLDNFGPRRGALRRADRHDEDRARAPYLYR